MQCGMAQVFTPPDNYNETCAAQHPETIPYSWTVIAGGETVRCNMLSTLQQRVVVA